MQWPQPIYHRTTAVWRSRSFVTGSLKKTTSIREKIKFEKKSRDFVFSFWIRAIQLNAHFNKFCLNTLVKKICKKDLCVYSSLAAMSGIASDQSHSKGAKCSGDSILYFWISYFSQIWAISKMQVWDHLEAHAKSIFSQKEKRKPLVWKYVF